MRCYHKALIYLSCALFLVFVAFANQLTPWIFLRLAIVAAACIPLMRTTQAICHQLDHTQLGRFIAPTCLETALVSLATAVALVVG